MPYIGPADLHDGRITDVQKTGNTVQVSVQTYEKKMILFTFYGVGEIHEEAAVGMLLYGLLESEGEHPFRLFTFSNWDEDDKAMLEISAESYSYTTG
jgi:hypothetical protein